MIKYLIALLVSIASISLAADVFVKGEFVVDDWTEQVTNHNYRVSGRYYDYSPAGFTAGDVAVSNLIFTELNDGSCDSWQITNIVAAGAINLTVDVVYAQSGSSTVGMVASYAGLCSLSTNSVGFPQIPSPEFCHLSGNLLNQIANYSRQRIPSGGSSGTMTNEPIAEAHITNTANPHAVTAAQVGAVPTNDPVLAAALTNAAVITTGTVWQVTLDPITRAFTFYAVTNGMGVGSGTFDYSALTNYFGNPNALPLTQAEKNFATSYFHVVFRTNMTVTTNGGIVYINGFDDMPLNAATGALNAAVGSLNASTATLDTAVGSLNIMMTAVTGATNLLNLATNALQLQATALAGATGALNSATNSLNSNLLTAAQKATATNALRLDGSTLPTAAQNWNGQNQTNIGTVQVTALQITGSPSNGAVYICTNTATGQGKWSWPVAFRAFLGSRIVTNTYGSALTCASNDYDYGFNFNLTTLVLPINGIYSFDVITVYGNTATYCYLSLYANGVIFATTVGPSAIPGESPLILHAEKYFTNGTPVTIKAYGNNICTLGSSGVDAYKSFFQSHLIREIP